MEPGATKPAEAGAAESSPGDEDALTKRLETLFSRDEFFKDPFIKQNVNAQMEIPVCILAGHPKLAELGEKANVDSLLEAAKRSDRVELDTEKMLIRPSLKPKRNTLILHGLLEGVDEAELRQLFEGSPEGKNLVSVKPDVNHTAFVAFTGDGEATNVALWLRSQKLRGETVKCSIKSETFHRGFFAPTAPPPVPIDPKEAMYAMSGHQAQMWLYSPGMWAQPDPTIDRSAWANEDGSMQWAPGESADGSGMWAPGEGDFGGKAKGKMKGKGKDKGFFDKGKGKGKPKGKGAGPFGGMEHQVGSAGGMPPMQEEAPIGQPPEDDFGPEPGYEREFRKYSRDQIIEICSGMAEVAKPESFSRIEAKDEGVALFRQSPCKDWAPLPAPQPPFNDRRGSAGDDAGGEADEGWGKRGGRKGQKGGWNRQSSEHEQGEWDEAEWWAWDGWWGDEARGSRRRSGGKGRGQWGEWQGPEQRWVQKHRPGEEEEQAESWPAARGSWADKARGGSQKWQAKAQPEAASTDAERSQEASSGSAGPSGPAAREGASAAAPAVPAEQPAGSGEPPSGLQPSC